MFALKYFLRAGIYLLAFFLSWNAMSAVHFEKFIKQGHVKQAQVLYVLLVMALAYLSGSFISIFMYQQ